MTSNKGKSVEKAAEEEDTEGETDKGAKQPTKEGVTVSEEYQTKAHHVTHKASKHELAHLRSKLNEREDMLRKAELDEKEAGKPEEFSTADAPVEV